jgi:CheY-like chemotaxis protein
MAEDVRERALDPFFTTKSEKGSGLGLSVVYGIVTRHGGNLDVWSEPGRGSRLTLRFPIAVAAIEAPRPAPAVGGTRQARVLVIDDEPAVLEALGDALGRDGHQVVACPDGPKALDRFSKEAFDLVITDLGMPGMSGWEVAAKIKAARADLPVLMITGWGEQIEPGEARAKGVDAVLAKPFTTVDLVTQVEELLSTRSRGAAPPLRNPPRRGEDRGPGRGRPGAA